ncbi:MAG: D-aminoacyl-tRNA deacylase [Acidimicrobiales bacterium]
MRTVVQRVARASVSVDGETIGRIDHGLCALVAVTHHDTPAQAIKLGDKLSSLRIFADEQGRANRSVLDVGGGVLVLSQFTLYADTTRGNRPGYTRAADPVVAAPLIEQVASRVARAGVPVATGRFGADMQVDLVNDGPFTVIIEVDP